MGFYRKPHPFYAQHIDVAEFRREEEISRTFARVMPMTEPCPFNPAGHHFTGCCGDVACLHCEKVVWS